MQLLERQVADLNKNVYTLQNEKSSYETIVFQLQQDVRSIQDKKQLAEDEKIRAQREAGNLRDEVRVQSCYMYYSGLGFIWSMDA